MLTCDAGKKEAIQHPTLWQESPNLLHYVISLFSKTMAWKTFITHIVSGCSVDASQKNILAEVRKVLSRITK